MTHDMQGASSRSGMPQLWSALIGCQWMHHNDDDGSPVSHRPLADPSIALLVVAYPSVGITAARVTVTTVSYVSYGVDYTSVFGLV